MEAGVVEKASFRRREPITQKGGNLLMHIAEAIMTVDSLAVLDVEESCHVFVVWETEILQFCL